MQGMEIILEVGIGRWVVGQVLVTKNMLYLQGRAITLLREKMHLLTVVRPVLNILIFPLSQNINLLGLLSMPQLQEVTGKSVMVTLIGTATLPKLLPTRVLYPPFNLKKSKAISLISGGYRFQMAIPTE